MSAAGRVAGVVPGLSLPLRYQRAARKLVARDGRLSRRQKALLYALIDRIDGRLLARASHAALAQDMGSSVGTVERAQRELVAGSMLRVKGMALPGLVNPPQQRTSRSRSEAHPRPRRTMTRRPLTPGCHDAVARAKRERV